MSTIDIIKGTSDHSNEIDTIVHDLIDYHKMSGQSVVDGNLINSTIGSFSDPSKYFESFLAIERNTGHNGDGSTDGGYSVIGHCMYQKYFSFLSGKVIWMENLFVQKNYRGKKIGQR